MSRYSQLARALVIVAVVGILSAVAAISSVSGVAADLLANLLASFTGALVAVWGAVWVSERREEKGRFELRRILADGVQKIQDAADDVLRSHEELPRGAVSDLSLRGDIREIVLPWQHVAAFRPYRELGDFEVISALADMDAECAWLTAVGAEPPNEYGSVDEPSGVTLSPPLIGSQRARTRQSVLRGASRIASAARTVVHLLQKTPTIR